MLGKLFKSSDAKEAASSADKLSPDHLRDEGECLLLSSGIPVTADSCAYDPAQKLLAVSISALLCGRRTEVHHHPRLHAGRHARRAHHLAGEAGRREDAVLWVEKALCHEAAAVPSQPGHPTAIVQGALHALFYAPCAACADEVKFLTSFLQAGSLEVWDLLSSSDLSEPDGVRARPTLKVEEGDKVRGSVKVDVQGVDPDAVQIRCVAPMFSEPHVALGCSSGSIRFASLVERWDHTSLPEGPAARALKSQIAFVRNGAPMSAVRQAHGLRLAQHSLAASQLQVRFSCCPRLPRALPLSILRIAARSIHLLCLGNWRSNRAGRAFRRPDPSVAGCALGGMGGGVGHQVGGWCCRVEGDV